MRLYTIGYGQEGLQGVLSRLEATLKQMGAQYFVVLDVRARPCGWSGELTYPNVAKCFMEAGHDYRWCPNLGNNAKNGSIQLVDERLGLAELKAALENLGPAAELVLMCAEWDPARCHRSYIARLAHEFWEVEVINL